MSELAVRLRHAIHADPEVGLQLPRTVAAVRAALAPLDLEIFETASASSFAAVIRGTGARGTAGAGAVLIRADMDALPVPELTGLPYASRNGAMHACGHDVHTATLVGTAHELHARRAELAGDVVLLFQAGEEAANGAALLIEDGLLEAPGVDYRAAMALHVLSTAELGTIASRPGAITGSGTSVRVVFRGRGGHGATPHESIDPLPALLAALSNIPVAFSRAIDAHEAVVFTPGLVSAGTRRNVIPDTAEFEATLRTFDSAVRDQAVGLVRRVVEGAALMHGVTAEVEITDGYPSVVVDAAEYESAARTLGSRGTLLAHPLAMTEDFARIAALIPSYFGFLGARPSGTAPADAAANHSSSALFDDEAIAVGIAVQAQWAIDRLAQSPETA